MKFFYITLVAMLTQACTTVGSVDRPETYYQGSTAVSNDELIETATLGDDDKKIAELLNHPVTLPERIRIAILKLNSDNSWRYYSDEFNQLNDSIVAGLITQLRNSDRVYDASFLPDLLTPEKRTITSLRESAARFQADLLLMYRSACQSYQKYKLINPNESKSHCTVEALLLDVRSGIIVKSVVSTEDFLAQKSDSDTNFGETIKKAELEAVAKALGSVADEVVAFLASVRQQAN